MKEDIDINNITKEKITSSPCLIGGFILKSIVKELSEEMSLFPNEDILTKEIESWKEFCK